MSETLKIQDEIYKRICFIHEVRGSHKTVSELLQQFSKRRLLKVPKVMRFIVQRYINEEEKGD